MQSAVGLPKPAIFSEARWWWWWWEGGIWVVVDNPLFKLQQNKDPERKRDPPFCSPAAALCYHDSFQHCIALLITLEDAEPTPLKTLQCLPITLNITSSSSSLPSPRIGLGAAVSTLAFPGSIPKRTTFL